MNDASVVPCDVETVLQQQAYLLFYVRYTQGHVQNTLLFLLLILLLLSGGFASLCCAKKTACLPGARALCSFLGPFLSLVAWH